jgi:hypothetical protein
MDVSETGLENALKSTTAPTKTRGAPPVDGSDSAMVEGMASGSSASAVDIVPNEKTGSDVLESFARDFKWCPVVAALDKKTADIIFKNASLEQCRLLTAHENEKLRKRCLEAELEVVELKKRRVQADLEVAEMKKKILASGVQTGEVLKTLFS